jgi:hypothetical protein
VVRILTLVIVVASAYSSSAVRLPVKPTILAVAPLSGDSQKREREKEKEKKETEENTTTTSEHGLE